MKPHARIALQRSAPLPVRNGVAPSRVYLPKGPWPSMYSFLAQRFPHVAEPDLRRRLLQGDIVDQAGRVVAASDPYVSDQWLWYYREVPDEAPVPFELPVLYQDDYLVAVDKPHFLASIPGGRYLNETALTRLRHALNMPSLTPLHRLDRDTAGVLLFCVHPPSRGAYQALFQTRDVVKVYEAVAPWCDGNVWPLHFQCAMQPVPGRFTMQAVSGSPNSETLITRVRAVSSRGSDTPLALYRLEPRTGRKHQLRVHMAALGAPLLNDRFYPVLQWQQAPDDFSNPLQLLARSVQFTDPVTGQARYFESRRRLAFDD